MKGPGDPCRRPVGVTEVEHVDASHIAELARAFRALANPTRLKMLLFLKERERYCGDMVKLFPLSQSTVSHHLKTLKDAGLVLVEERGTATCYRVNEARLSAVKEALRALL